MDRLFKLHNTIKKYAWGSPVWIPQLLGTANNSQEPWAELWMGVHTEGPSQVDFGGISIKLGDLIQQAPRFYLGSKGAKDFGTLPFLLKLLAAAQPLSIQAHPNLEQARIGWEKENQAGISLNAPNRNYRDANHKPELLCALTPFRGMCGFRKPEEIQIILDIFSRYRGAALLTGALDSALQELKTSPTMRDFLITLLGFSEERRKDLCAYTLRQGPELEKIHPEFAAEWRTAIQLARLYPNDPGIIAPFYLNLINLAPGEAIFLPAGVLHAYLEGFGVELMANSDNVLRGGLTSKHIDIRELIKILSFTPFVPKILKPEINSGRPFARFPLLCREFSLAVQESRGGSSSIFLEGPAIILVTAGRVTLSQGTERLTLTPGESAYIAPGENPEELQCSGTYVLYIAETGLISQ